MTSALPIGIITAVLVALYSMIGGFPGGADATTPPADVNSQGAAEMLGGKLLSDYTSVIEGLMAHQREPDHERAEQQRQELLTFSKEMAPKFQELANEYQEKLDGLTPGGDGGDEASSE